MNGDVIQQEWHEFMSKGLTVIGNIFENRDLLLEWFCNKEVAEELWEEMRRYDKEADKGIWDLKIEDGGEYGIHIVPQEIKPTDIEDIDCDKKLRKMRL